MSETPVPRDPGRDEDPPGLPAGPGDHPSLWSGDWLLVPSSPDWDEAYLAAMADDEYPGDLDLYQDPDNAPPAGLDDGVGTLRSGQCPRNDYERLRDTFGAFMKASTSSGYGKLPWLPR